MMRISIDEAKDLRALLERAEAGEEIAILREGKEVARLVPTAPEPKRFPDLSEFRASIKLKGESPLGALLKLREEAR
jgi:antitoxin (DNA-binding transcriptional repressor) of toxin-antitoxin stability system